MSKLYAEIDSEKHGRKGSKAGDNYLRIEVTRKNIKLGTLGVYEVLGASPEAYRIVWHHVAGKEVMLVDTETKGT